MAYRITPQRSINPKVHAAPARECHDGPAEGNSYQLPDGFILIMARVKPDTVDVVALPPVIPVGSDGMLSDQVQLSKKHGTYMGHYVIGADGLLHYHYTP